MPAASTMAGSGTARATVVCTTVRMVRRVASVMGRFSYNVGKTLCL